MRQLWVAALCGVLLLGAASPVFCGQKKRQKHVDKWPDVDLSVYSHIFIEDFTMKDPKAHKRKKQHQVKTVGDELADGLAKALEPGLFGQVTRVPSTVSTPAGVPGGLIVRGEILQYKPGSAFGRAMLAGAGSAHLDFTVHLIATETSRELTSFSAKRTWAWGGIYGASKGIAEMENNVSEEIAIYIEDNAGTRRFEPTETVDLAVQSTPVALAPVTDQPSYIVELKALAELHREGILTDEEYEAKKRQVLDLEKQQKAETPLEGDPGG